MQASSFLTTETGAVTVDWVVLTAALVGLGLATMAVVSQGVENVSGDIDGQLKQDGIIMTSFPAHHVSVDAIPYEGDSWGAIMAALEGEVGTSQMQTLNQAARAGDPAATWEALATYDTGNPEDQTQLDMYTYIAQVQGVPIECLDTDTCGQGEFPGIN